MGLGVFAASPICIKIALLTIFNLISRQINLFPKNAQVSL